MALSVLPPEVLQVGVVTVAELNPPKATVPCEVTMFSFDRSGLFLSVPEVLEIESIVTDTASVVLPVFLR